MVIRPYLRMVNLLKTLKVGGKRRQMVHRVPLGVRQLNCLRQLIEKYSPMLTPLQQT